MSKSRLTPEERGRQRWAQIIALDSAQERIIESLRYRDQDHHIRCGAILGFAGLLIASDLVQLSAGERTIAFMDRNSGWLPVAALSMIALMASASLSLVSISWGRWSSYSAKPWEALHQLADMINLRSFIESVAIAFCVAGFLGSLSSLLATLFGVTLHP